jgi:hypothetical protein
VSDLSLNVLVECDVVSSIVDLLLPLINAVFDSVDNRRNADVFNFLNNSFNILNYCFSDVWSVGVISDELLCIGNYSVGDVGMSDGPVGYRVFNFWDRGDHGVGNPCVYVCNYSRSDIRVVRNDVLQISDTVHNVV